MSKPERDLNIGPLLLESDFVISHGNGHYQLFNHVFSRLSGKNSRNTE